MAVPAGATTWRVVLVTRIAVALYTAFVFGMAGFILFAPVTRVASSTGVDWMLLATALVMCGFGTFGAFALTAVLRINVRLDATTLAATVVTGHNRFLVPRFRTIGIPLREIAAVQRRSEVYRIVGLHSMRDALSIVTTSGERIGLFSNTLGSSDTLPFDDVANGIAAAAHVAVTDDGTVLAQGPGLYGAASSQWTEAPLDAVHAAKARRTVIATLGVTTALLLLSVLLRVVF